MFPALESPGSHLQLLLCTITMLRYMAVCRRRQSGVTTWILLLLLPHFVVRLRGCLQRRGGSAPIAGSGDIALWP
jgi:hypothetical protein